MAATGQQKQVSMPRRIAPWLVLVTAVAITAGIKIDADSRPTLLAGPMVNMPEHDRYVISWAWTPSSAGWVSLSRPGGTSETIEAKLIDGRYHAELSKIAPGTAYQYTVQCEGTLGRRIDVAGPYGFSGPPTTDSEFRFIALGDSGNGSNTQTSLAALMAKQSPQLIIHVGDLVYPAGATSDYAANFYEPNAELIRSIPFMPCEGNHDVATELGAPLLREFVLPRNGPPGIEPERNYWFDYGNARFVALDTNLKAAHGAITHEEMKTTVATWLRKVLTDSAATWKFVYFHHPFYTGSSHSAEGSAYVKEAYLDVMESAGVDIVFWGHNHLYERIGPMWKDNLVADTATPGIVYITTGAGGVSRYPERDDPPAYVRAHNDEVFSFTVVDVNGSRLRLRQISEDNQVIDEISLVKPAAVGGESR